MWIHGTTQTEKTLSPLWLLPKLFPNQGPMRSTGRKILTSKWNMKLSSISILPRKMCFCSNLTRHRHNMAATSVQLLGDETWNCVPSSMSKSDCFSDSVQSDSVACLHFCFTHSHKGSLVRFTSVFEVHIKLSGRRLSCGSSGEDGVGSSRQDTHSSCWSEWWEAPRPHWIQQRRPSLSSDSIIHTLRATPESPSLRHEMNWWHIFDLQCRPNNTPLLKMNWLYFNEGIYQLNLVSQGIYNMFNISSQMDVTWRTAAAGWMKAAGQFITLTRPSLHTVTWRRSGRPTSPLSVCSHSRHRRKHSSESTFKHSLRLNRL